MRNSLDSRPGLSARFFCLILHFPSSSMDSHFGISELRLAHRMRPMPPLWIFVSFLNYIVIEVWLYAHILTVGGAYNDAASRTQTTCRTDRSGLITGAPWEKGAAMVKKLGERCGFSF